MTLKVVFRKAARTEFDAAALWYKQRHPSLGLRFVAEIDRAVELAAANPNRFPMKHGQIRCASERVTQRSGKVTACARPGEGRLERDYGVGSRPRLVCQNANTSKAPSDTR